MYVILIGRWSGERVDEREIWDSVQQKHPCEIFQDKQKKSNAHIEIINSVPYNFMTDSPILDA